MVKESPSFYRGTLLSLLTRPALAFTETFTLGTDIIAKQGAEDKILFQVSVRSTGELQVGE